MRRGFLLLFVIILRLAGYCQLQQTYAFNTTNFDDGWVSTIHDEWVQVDKANVKVILHYPRPMKNHTMFPLEINTAWDTLVSDRYASLNNFKTSYISDYKHVDIAMGNVTDNNSTAKVFLVLFRRTGAGWIEVVTSSKKVFIDNFHFDPEAIRWDSNPDQTDVLANMIERNRFAIAAPDLYGTGEWRQHYSSHSFWANYYTGAYEGMSTYSSSQWFIFGKGQTYKWQLVVANSSGGRSQFANANGAGTFRSVNNWQLYFSQIEGKPKTYDGYYTAVRGGRVLWLKDANYSGSGVYTGFEQKR